MEGSSNLAINLPLSSNVAKFQEKYAVILGCDGSCGQLSDKNTAFSEKTWHSANDADKSGFSRMRKIDAKVERQEEAQRKKSRVPCSRLREHDKV